MKAKIKPLIILIAIFVVSLAAGVAAGCKIGERTSKDVADQQGLTCPVTYYANGGSFLVGTSPDVKVYRTVYYKPDTPIFNIGEGKTVGQALTITRSSYVFAGWEYCVLDADGNPVLKDYEGNTLPYLENGTASIKDSAGREISEQQKRFTATPNGTKAFENGNIVIHEGEHIFLAATWTEDVVLEYKLVTDSPITASATNEDGETEEVTYYTGDTIAVREYGIDSAISLRPETAPATFATHSYIHIYYDEECTRPVTAGDLIDKPTDGNNPVIYAKYLSGKWTPVRTASNVASMLSSVDKNNYFIVYDIDCTGSRFSLKSSGTFSGRIEGNGFTISNITNLNVSAVTKEQQLSNGQTYSLFGNLGADALINDLTIESITLGVQVRSAYNVAVYALFSTVAQGAKLNNFSVESVELSIDRQDESAVVSNIQFTDGGYNTDSWLYGSTYANDAAFEQEYYRIVNNASINNI